MPKIVAVFQFDVSFVHAFDLRQPPTPAAQTPDQPLAGAGVARSAAVGDSIGTGTPSGQDHREHGRGTATVGEPPTAASCAPSASSAQNTHAARDCAHHGGTSDHYARSACGRSTQHSTDSPRASGTIRAHRRSDSTRRQLRQAGLPQRLASVRRRRHCHVEIFDRCGWPRHASRR